MLTSLLMKNSKYINNFILFFRVFDFSYVTEDKIKNKLPFKLFRLLNNQ